MPDTGTLPVEAGTNLDKDATAPADASRDGGRDAAAPDASVDAATGDAAVVDAGPLDPAVPGNDAPVLSKIGYFNDELGPRILIQGRDPNGDVASYTVKTFKADASVSFNFDGKDDTPDTDSFTGDLVSPPGEAGFFLSDMPSADLLDRADQVKISVADAMHNVSSELSAKLMAAPTAGATCSPLGFDRCSGANVCATSGASFRCASVSSARATACSAGQVLVLHPPAVTSVSGNIKLTSLWDAPLGCITGDVKSQPDTIVKLTLDAPAATVVLSTDNASTPFDTVLYTLDKCDSTPTACVDSNCACAQDVSGSNPRSVLTLTNVTKGDHYIVVDSFPSTDAKGTAFQLTVSLP